MPTAETYILVRIREEDFGRGTYPHAAEVRNAIHEIALIHDVKVADVPIREGTDPWNGAPNPAAKVKAIFDSVSAPPRTFYRDPAEVQRERDSKRARHVRQALIRLGKRYKALQGKILEAEHIEEIYRAQRMDELKRQRRSAW